MAEKKSREGLVDGCFLTWVQVTEHFSNVGMINEETRNFRKKS